MAKAVNLLFTFRKLKSEGRVFRLEILTGSDTVVDDSGSSVEIVFGAVVNIVVVGIITPSKTTGYEFRRLRSRPNSVVLLVV